MVTFHEDTQCAQFISDASIGGVVLPDEEWMLLAEKRSEGCYLYVKDGTVVASVPPPDWTYTWNKDLKVWEIDKEKVEKKNKALRDVELMSELLSCETTMVTLRDEVLTGGDPALLREWIRYKAALLAALNDPALPIPLAP